MKIFGKDFSFGSDPDPVPVLRSGLLGQLETLDMELADLTSRLERLGLFVRNDGGVNAIPAPPVASFCDAVEFINTRVDLLHELVGSIEDKLGIA